MIQQELRQMFSGTLNTCGELFVDALQNWHSAATKEHLDVARPHVISATVSALLVEAFYI
jgi:hypothetical protein